MDLPKPQLSDGVVTLRLWQPQDAEALCAIYQQESILRWTRAPEGYDLTLAMLHINYAEEQRQAGKELLCAVVDDRGKLLGTCDLRVQADDPEVGEVAYMLSEEARGRGVMTRSLRLMATYAFSELGMKRLEALVHPNNEASLALLRKAGFTEEGHLRDYLIRKGKREDRIICSLLADDER